MLSKARVLPNALAEKCVNSVRVLAAEVVEKAKSGHPGAPMGCAPIAHVLFKEIMNFSPSNPKWCNRDRFILSNGHACALLYSMLHLTGYGISIDDLQQFRQLGSLTPGHPENFLTPGVEVSTGPLGQGISNAVGIAMAERHLAAEFNQEGFNVMDHFTYVICGDGCLQEGVSAETGSLAGHLGLGKLIVCYDDNLITIDGSTELSFTEDVNKRYEAYGWHVQTVADGNDTESIRNAVLAAQQETGKPSLIKIRTIIGYGSAIQGSHKVHGAPLGATDMKQLKSKFGFDPEASFLVEEDVKVAYNSVGRGEELVSTWTAMFDRYCAAHPELGNEFRRRCLSGDVPALPANWKDGLPVYSAATEQKAAATRNRSEEVLNAVAKACPEIIGGSADLTPSNLTALKGSGDFQASTPGGRYIRFGVREHGMAAICNGMIAHGGVRPFCATFLNFAGYALGSMRLSSLSQFGVLYVMTHDSIGLGEDGPTHQPVEMLEMLRAHPNMNTFRPADGNETVGAYVSAMETGHTPTVVALSRQACPTLANSCAIKSATHGGYILDQYVNGVATGSTADKPSIIFVSTGTEVSLAVEVAKKITASGVACVRVVSMPCCDIFNRQSLDYQMSVFPDGSPTMSIEASGCHGWRQLAHAPFGMSTFGASAPGGKLYDHFGFTVENLGNEAKNVIEFYKSNGAQGDNEPMSMIRYPRFASAKGKTAH